MLLTEGRRGDAMALFMMLVGMPPENLAQVQQASYPFMRTAAAALAGAIPDGRYQVLAGQTHEVAAEVLAPVLIDFFCEEGE